MPNLQPLIDAVAFVKANPDKHNQGYSHESLSTRCVVSYACENAGFKTFEYEKLAEFMGVDWSEMNSLYYTMDNATAIRNAEALIAKYSLAPVVENEKIEDFCITFIDTPGSFVGTLEEAKLIANFLKSVTSSEVSITRTITEKVDF